MSTNKFRTPVALACTTQEQAADAIMAMKDIDYPILGGLSGSPVSFAAYWLYAPGGDHKLHWATLGDMKKGTILVNPFNLKMFKALASMRSEGWGKGELVASLHTSLQPRNEPPAFTVGGIYECRDAEFDTDTSQWLVKVKADNQGSSNQMWAKHFQKPTVQEILSHFGQDAASGQPDPSLMEPAIQPAPAHEQGGGYDQAQRLMNNLHERSQRPLFISVSTDWAKMHPEWFKTTPGPVKMSGREYLDSMTTPNIINATAVCLAEKQADTVTITPEQFKEIWNVFPVNLQHSILDKMDGHIYREAYAMDRRIINHLYSMAPFGVRDILDKHLKVPSFDVSQMLSGEAMLIEDKSCMFNGEIIVKVGDTFLCINKDGDATRYDPGTLITGRKIPAGTTIAFKTA